GRDLDVAADAAVVVPVAVVQLDEAHAPLRQAPGQQAVGGEGAVPAVRAVQVEDFPGLAGDVHQPGHAGLHAEGHLVLGDARGDLGVVVNVLLHPVQGLHRLDHVALAVGG